MHFALRDDLCHDFSLRLLPRGFTIFVLIAALVIVEATEVCFLDDVAVDLTCSRSSGSTTRKCKLTRLTSSPFLFVVVIVQLHARRVEVIELRQTLAVVGQLILIIEVERGSLRGALSFTREPFEHTLFRSHRRVIFTEATIENSTSMVPLLILLQKGFLPL